MNRLIVPPHVILAEIARLGGEEEDRDAATPRGRSRNVQPCGTAAAYKRHGAHGEVPCRPCMDAMRERSRRRRTRGA